MVGRELTSRRLFSAIGCVVACQQGVSRKYARPISGLADKEGLPNRLRLGNQIHSNKDTVDIHDKRGPHPSTIKRW